jgi:hypothetical protein
MSQACLALERLILGLFLSKPFFRIDPKGKRDPKGGLACSFEQFVW